MSQDIRVYDRHRDLAAIKRIWREVGWIDDEAGEKALEPFLDASSVEVGMLDGEAECSVVWCPGSINYQSHNLPLSVVTAVTTSRVARKQGLATAMTARAVQAGAESGAAVAALGMFDQGFYDRLGFGTNTYHLEVSFDPATLYLPEIDYRRPVRLGPDDHLEMHALLHRRARTHGSVAVDPPEVLKAELEWTEKPFGLGYRNDEGQLTHFLYGEAKAEHGPYHVRMMAYEEPRQLLDLLRLLQEMADQVTSVRMPEPPEIQLQDFVRKPIAQRTRSKGSTHEAGIWALAWMQFRILDLPACIGARSWPGPELRFNLSLTDPVTAQLERAGAVDDGWSGVGGDYTVSIGETSTVVAGNDASLPSLNASVGAFTRCWFGARPATGLGLTGRAGVEHFEASPELLADLDVALALPPPRPGWDF